jgi:putative ABC transport system substrate-binding protein
VLQWGLAGVGQLVPSWVNAQAASRQRPRILMITFRGETDVERGFRDYLANAGVDADILHRDVNRDAGKVAGVLQEALAFKPQLIYTWGTPVTLAVTGTHDKPAGHALAHVPVVFALVAAPVQAGIVPALTGQGRNITGAVHVVPTAVQMRAMQSYRAFNKLGVLYTSTEANSRVIVEEVRAFARGANVEVIERTFRLNSAGKPVADGVEDLVADIARAGAQWLYLLPDTFLGSLYNRLTPAALERRLPTFGAAELAVRSGGALVGLVSRYHSVGQLAASKAVEILMRDKKASSLPVETLKRFSLIVNIDAARALGGMYPPIEMLKYAEIIQPSASRPAS